MLLVILLMLLLLETDHLLNVGCPHMELGIRDRDKRTGLVYLLLVVKVIFICLQMFSYSSFTARRFLHYRSLS